MTRHLEHIAARVLGQPLLIHPPKLGIIAQVLAGRIGLDLEAPELGLDVDERPTPLASRFVGTRRDAESGNRLPYVRTDAGVAILTITGSLVNRGAWIGASSGLTAYEGIAAQIRAALDDPKVTSILLDIDSPGGEATGAFELADFIQVAGAAKPVTAFVNGLAASAGYMIASAAQRIVSIPSGVTGSIGVVMMHADYSRMLDRAGITPSFIYAGDHKVDGNPYEPLAQDVRDRLKAEVEQMREEFARMVAKGRGGRMSAQAALDTQARTYSGAEAQKVGLVDDLATFDALFEDMNRSASAKGRSPARKPAGAAMFTQADLDTARAEGHAVGLAEGKIEGHVAGLAEGTKAGAEAERARVKAIVGHPEAKGREGLAAHYAYETDQTPEAAAAALKVSAKGSSLADRAASAETGPHTAGTHADAARKPVTIDARAIYAEFNKRG